DEFDGAVWRLRGDPVGAERAVLVAAAEIAAADLPDQVAAECAMIPADPALAGIVGEAPELGSAVEGANGVGAQRAEAHGGNVEQRQGVGLAAVGAAHRGTKVVTFDRARNDRMIDPLEIVAVDVLLGAERPLVERALRALISNRPFRSIERRAVGFALQKILTDFRPDLFQHEADVGEDGIIPPHAVLGLEEIPNAD